MNELTGWQQFGVIGFFAMVFVIVFYKYTDGFKAIKAKKDEPDRFAIAIENNNKALFSISSVIESLKILIENDKALRDKDQQQQVKQLDNIEKDVKDVKEMVIKITARGE